MGSIKIFSTKKHLAMPITMMVRYIICQHDMNNSVTYVATSNLYTNVIKY